MNDNVNQFLPAKRPKNKNSHKKLVIVAILALVILIGGVLFIITNSTKPNNTQIQKKPEITSSGIKIKSSIEIRAQLNNTTDQSKKNRLNQDLITSLQLEGDLEGAIKVAIEYSNTVKTADSYGLLAGIYESKGERLLAKTYYQKAIDLSEKTDLDQRSPYSYFYDKLQTLKDI